MSVYSHVTFVANRLSDALLVEPHPALPAPIHLGRIMQGDGNADGFVQPARRRSPQAAQAGVNKGQTRLEISLINAQHVANVLLVGFQFVSISALAVRDVKGTRFRGPILG